MLWNWHAPACYGIKKLSLCFDTWNAVQSCNTNISFLIIWRFLAYNGMPTYNMNSPSNSVGSSRETSSFGAAQFQSTERGSVSARAFRGICLDVTVHLTCPHTGASYISSNYHEKSSIQHFAGNREKPFLLHPFFNASIGFHLEDLRFDKFWQE